MKSVLGAAARRTHSLASGYLRKSSENLRQSSEVIGNLRESSDENYLDVSRFSYSRGWQVCESHLVKTCFDDKALILVTFLRTTLLCGAL